MTRETFTPSPLYTISGTGPYPITHPYQVATEIVATIFQGTTIVELVYGTDFTVAPSTSETTGDVTLSSTMATTYAGARLLIRRATVADQGWAGQTARERGLEAQMDAMTQRMQEIDEALARAVKIPEGTIGKLPLDLASQWLGFDASNQIIVGAGAVAGTAIPVTSFMATLLDDPDAATARATLGAGTGTMGNLVDDTSPQLGGPLDTNNKAVFWSKGADVSSAADLPVLTDGNSFDVTGTSTISTIESTANAFGIGAVILLHFVGTLTLTNSANLVLLGGANITVSAGDEAIFVKIASGQWRMVSFSGISPTADWQAGTSHKPSLASPANVQAAIDQQNQILQVSTQPPSGTAGAAMVSGWANTHPLDTVDFNSISGASLDATAHSITLPAGTYDVSGFAQIQSFYGGSTRMKVSLYDVTAAAMLVIGGGSIPSDYATSALPESPNLPIHGRFTLTATHTLTVACYTNTTSGAIMGAAISSGEKELFASLTFRKVG